jgi:ATP-binding cassette, subfamily B, bacterial
MLVVGGDADGGDEGRSWRRLPRLIAASFRIVWQAAPRELAITMALLVLQGVATGLNLLIIRNVLAAILAGAPQHDYVPALQQLALLVVLQALTGLAGLYQNMQQSVLTELVQRHASRPVTEVATRIELRDFDTPHFHDRMQRAQQTAMMRPYQVTQAVLTIGQSVLTLCGLLVALLFISPLLVALSLLGFLPLWLATMRVSRAVFEFMLEMTPNDRKRNYVLSLLTDRNMAKEVRAFGLGGYLREVYEQLSDERLVRLREHIRQRAWISGFGSVGSALASGVMFAALAWLITSGHLGLAAAGAAATAAIQLGGSLQGVVFGAGQLYESSLFVEDLNSFVQQLPALRSARPTQPAPRGFERIEVQDVRFTYPVSIPAPARAGPPSKVRFFGLVPPMFMFSPGADGEAGHQRPDAIRGVSLEIRKGEVIALVGENGSGKTTLAKLICGLYQPEGGRILWDGTDMSRVDPDGLRDQVTVIFQDFVRYWLSARQNIGLGRVARMDDVEAVRAAARHSGADQFIERWPESYESLLGPIFEGGKDLSTGQWQRIALARAFFRDAPLIILDEPTASLDARAEADLFARIRTLFIDRSVLLISHRFSSVRSADRIYVLSEGEIVEHGSHPELMARCGLYAELFNLQAAAYQDGRTPSPAAAEPPSAPTRPAAQ